MLRFFNYCDSPASNLPTYTGCLPGISFAGLVGHYMVSALPHFAEPPHSAAQLYSSTARWSAGRCVSLSQYDLQVDISGVPCSVDTSHFEISATSYFCRLPAFEYDPAVAYDLVAYNDDGNRTISGLVQFTSQPTLISIDGCIDRGDVRSGYYYGVQCPVGTTVTLRGTRFMTAGSLIVQLVSVSNSAVTVSLSAATLLDSSTITTTLIELDSVAAAALYGKSNYVSVLFMTSNTTTATNALLDGLYIAPNAPNITSVTSSMCDSVSTLQLANCRATAAITLTGTNLAPGGEMTLVTSSGDGYLGFDYLLASSNATFDSVSNISLVFKLSYFDANTDVDLLPDVVYTLFLASRPGGGLLHLDSNAFRLSLSYGTDAIVSDQSSKELSAGAIAGVVIAVVVVAVLLLAVAVGLGRGQISRASSSPWSSETAPDDSLRWSLRLSSQQSSDSHHRSDEFQAVEMHVGEKTRECSEKHERTEA